MNNDTQLRLFADAANAEREAASAYGTQKYMDYLHRWQASAKPVHVVVNAIRNRLQRQIVAVVRLPMPMLPCEPLWSWYTDSEGASYCVRGLWFDAEGYGHRSVHVSETGHALDALAWVAMEVQA